MKGLNSEIALKKDIETNNISKINPVDISFSNVTYSVEI